MSPFIAFPSRHVFSLHLSSMPPISTSFILSTFLLPVISKLPRKVPASLYDPLFRFTTHNRKIECHKFYSVNISAVWWTKITDKHLYSSNWIFVYCVKKKMKPEPSPPGREKTTVICGKYRFPCCMVFICFAGLVVFTFIC